MSHPKDLFNSLSVRLRPLMGTARLASLDALLRQPYRAGDLDVFATALNAATSELSADEKLVLAITACHYGKAGHDYLLLKAGADPALLALYGNIILPDEDRTRLRYDAANTAVGHLTFDRIMQEHGKGEDVAYEMARDRDFLYRYPERYGDLARTTDPALPKTTETKKPRR